MQMMEAERTSGWGAEYLPPHRSRTDNDDGEGRDSLAERSTRAHRASGTADGAMEVHWVGETRPLPEDLGEFADVFKRFMKPEDLTGAGGPTATPRDGEATDNALPADIKSEPNEDGEPSADAMTADGETKAGGEKKLSRKQRRLAKRLTVAELKQLVKRPDVVELHDTTAADPRLLVHLKSYRNSVPVPRHWCQKRKYLQGKRGLEKSAYRLPEFIEATGIATMRDAIRERDESKKQKAKARERARPKMGRMDVNYRLLHDAFFRHQTRPPLTLMGDLYYEGKEFEVKSAKFRPGHLSEDLKIALGMMPGNPPPYLFNMQRFGPPPSYPNLKVPGVNAPIPIQEGAQYGTHPGGWGRPPMNEYGMPLYGDVYGVPQVEASPADSSSHWGEFVEVEPEEPEEPQPEEAEGAQEGAEEEPEGAAEGEAPAAAKVEEGEGAAAATATFAPTAAAMAEGTAGGIGGLETPADGVQLRKRIGIETEEPEGEKRLYEVLPEVEASVGTALFGSNKRYLIPGQAPPEGATAAAPAAEGAMPPPAPLLAGTAGAPVGRGKDRVALSLNPEELSTLTEDTLRQRYEEQLRVERSAAAELRDGGAETGTLTGTTTGTATGLATGTASGLVSGETSAIGHKHAGPPKEGSGKTKKYKDFKF